MYLVAGVLFNKFNKGASGKEVIPNINFWMDFPLLVKVCKGLTWRNPKYLDNNNILLYYMHMGVF